MKFFIRKLTQNGWIAAIILLLVIGLAACSSGGQKNQPKSSINAADSSGFRADTAHVKVVQVEGRSFEDTLHSTGTLQARQQATVRAKVSGEIQKVYVDIGDRVHKGDILVKIDPKDFQLQLQQAKAQLASAKATLDNKKTEMKRMKGLYKAGSATEQNKDQAVTAYRQAKAQYQQMQAAENTARQKLDYTSIQAPFSGVVTKRDLKKGDYVNKGQAAAQVTNLSVMEAKMDIPERYAGSLQKGLPVTLHFQSQNQPAKGKIVAINPHIDTDSRTFLVKVQVNNKDRKLSDGLFFKSILKLPRMKNQPAVPVGAVRTNQGQNILWVIKDGKAHRQV
ncbi:MAG TPA: efflux RND transporter periplasmic adaptor subunit, partial [Balneolaceae bacterium]|nr:efflux RND transporter periplasmic adaptor subunit [Balneolaceae bacterium]